MKKIEKVIFIFITGICSLFICFVISEYRLKYCTFKPCIYYLAHLFNYKEFCSYEDFLAKNPWCFPLPVIRNNSKPSVVLMGCSFAQGFNIHYSKRPAVLFSYNTDCSVYDLSFGGGGIQHNYSKIFNDEYTKNIKNPKFIIYVFINDQVRRLYKYRFGDKNTTYEYLRYKKVHGKYEKIKPHLTYFWKFYTVKAMQDLITTVKEHDKEKSFNDFSDMMLKIKEKTDELWPNSKFIILTFPNSGNYDYDKKADWSKLKEHGIEVVSTEDFFILPQDNPDDYFTRDKFHPNEKYWEEIIPKFVQKYEMRY